MKLKELPVVIYERLHDLFYLCVKRPIKTIIKTIQYLPVLWDDEDWDYYYLLKLLEYKLKRMKKCFIREHIVAEDELELIIDSIEETCEHIFNYDESYKVYNNLYKLPFKVEGRVINKEGSNEFYVVDYNKDEDRPLNKSEQKKYRSHLKGMSKYREREWKNIWKNIEKYGELWWD